MCHNDLFLTLWLKDLPSSLETTSSTLHTTSLSRIYQTTFDDTSGYVSGKPSLGSSVYDRFKLGLKETST